MKILVLPEKTKTRYIDATHTDIASKYIVEARLRHGWYRDDEKKARKAVRLGKFFEYLTTRKNEIYESFDLVEIESTPEEIESRYS